MSMPRDYEVFVLLDHANELAVHDVCADRWLLDVTAGMYLASDVACGEPEVAPELPTTVRECVARAAQLTAQWDSAELTPSGRMLVALLATLAAEMGC
ncbi:hypothetical protein [Tessaracoccus sp. MC1756]|uniref:hypothetical protein n=1 Tax=Tessaracoccus sp. MC1756 TaxID=2760311 RepID=UPI00160011A5|nr:hypothetical protein [Tessaracoccus sp. MC1756]MBB1510959.1 hypothetical protein [Tessaracoccus sp. MC1756]